MKFLSRFDDFESIIVDGDVQSSGLSSLYIKDSVNSILRIGNTTGDSFITYDGTELSISSDLDLRLTTPTDQDVFLITSSGNIVTTQGGGTFTIGGGLTLENFGAGYLKTDANGVVSIDTDIIEDTLDSVTDRNAVTTNAITVGGLTVGDSHFIGNESTYDNLLLRSSSGESIVLGSNANLFFNTGATANNSVGTTRMYIDSTSGAVGIGTTSPTNKLDIRQSTSGGSDVLGTGAITIGSDNPYWTLRGTATSLQDLAFDRSYAGTWYESMRIQRSTGNVGIGTSTPENKLHLLTSTTDTTQQLLIQNGSTGDAAIKFNISGDTYSLGIDNSDSDKFKLSAGNLGTNDRLVIDSTGNVGIGTTSPAYKLDVAGTAVFGTNTSNNAVKISVNQASTFPGSNTSYSRFVDFIGGNTGANTEIGGIRWLNTDSDNGNYQYHAAGITSHNKGSSNDGDLRFFVSSDASADSSTGVIEAVRINTTGKVGIGTTSPLEKLDIRGDVQMYNSYASGVEIKMNHVDPSTGYNSSIIKSVLDTIDIQDAGSSMLRFYTNDNSTTSPTVALDLTSESNAIFYGKVGIGTTSPSTPLHVIGIAQVVTGSDPAFYEGDGVRVFGTQNYRFRNQPGEVRAIIDLNSTGVTAGNLSLYNASNVVTTKLHNAGDSFFNGGNVGIGTTSPGQKLDVAGRVRISTDPTLELYNTSTNRGGVQWVDGSLMTKMFSGGSAGAGAGIIFETNTSEKVRITSTGNVGIGTTSPSEKLHVYNAGTSFIKVDSGADSPYMAGVEFLRSSINGGRIYNDGGAVQVKLESYYGYEALNPTRGGFTFKTAPVTSGTLVDALRINALGNVGIGTTSPSQKLHVSDTVAGYVSTIENLGTGADKSGLWIKTDSSWTSAVILKLTGSPSDNSIMEVNPATVRIGGGALTVNDATLHVQGTSFFFDQSIFDDKVGIGTTSPGTINGVAFSSVGLHVNAGTLGRTITEGSGWAEYILNDSGASVNQRAKFIESNDGTLSLGSYDDNGTQRTQISILNGGNVGIGTTNPGANLYVSGGNADATDKPTMISESVFTIKPVALNSGNLNFAQVDSGNSIGMQYTNGAGTANWDISMQPFGGNVGIGTTSPTQRLEVAGNAKVTGVIYTDVVATNSGTAIDFRDQAATSIMYLDATNKRVGIGTTAPVNKLQVNYTPYGISSLTATAGTAATNWNRNAGLMITGASVSNALALGASGTANDRKAWIQVGHPDSAANSLGVLALNPLGGNVGIGTTSPNAKLEVTGATPTGTTGYSDNANSGQIYITSNAAVGSQLGGRIAFGGIAGNGGGAFTGTRQDSVYGTIEGYKYNTTANNSGGGLSFKTNFNNTGALIERLNIDQAGAIKFNAYGAGILKTDASGNVSLDTSTYLTSVAFSDLTSKPTTIAGYGITDALVIGTTATTAMAGDTAIPVSGTDFDPVGTDNSTDVTLVTTSYDYLSISGQEITLGQVDYSTDIANTPTIPVSGTDFDPVGTDNSTDVTLAAVTGNYLTISGQEITAGTVPVSLGGTGATTAADARTNLGVDAAGTDNSTDVTLVTTSHDYLSLSGQAITLDAINLDDINGGATAGYLKTDASGNITVDTSTIEDTLDTVTTRSGTTSNTIQVGGITVAATFPYLDFVDTNSFTDGADRFRIRAGVNEGLVQWYDDSASSLLSIMTFQPNGNVIVPNGNVGIGTTSPGAKLTVDGQVQVEGGGARRYALQPSYWGYSSSYRTLILGSASTSYTTQDTGSVTLAFGVDVSANTSGSFGGNGSELLFRNGASFTTPNAANTGYHSQNLVLKDGSVGIGTASPSEKLEVNGNIRLGNNASLLWGSNSLTLKTASSSTIGVFSLAPNSAGTVYAPRFQMLNASSVVGVSIRTDADSYFNGGNVGIGTTTPGVRLHVVGTENSNWVTQFSNANTNGHSVFTGYNNGTTEYGLYVEGGPGDAGGFDILVSGNKFAVRSDGNVGIGTTSPTSKLHVQGTSYFFDQSIFGDKVGIGTTSPSEKLTVDAQAADGVTTTIASFHSNEGETGDTAIQLAVNRSDSLGSDRKTFLNATGAGNFEIQRSGSTKVTIEGAGNVGIGINTPTDKLTVNGNLSIFGNKIYNGSASNSAGVSFPSSTVRIDGYNGITFHASATTVGSQSERMRITSAGNVGIGTTSPVQKLQVDGNVYSNGGEFFVNTNKGITAVGNLIFKAHDGSSYFEGMRIASDGNVGIGTTSPGAKLHVGSRGTAAALTPPATDGLLFDFHNDGSPYIRHAAIISQASDATESVIDFWTKVASGTSSKKMTIRGNGNLGIGTADPTTKLHVAGTAETRLRVGSSNASSNVVLELRDENSPTGQGTVITYNNATGETYFNNALSTATTDFHFQSGEYGTASDFFTLSNSGGNAIAHLSTTTGDAFITYEDSINELAIASDGDLRLTTPTDQDVFFISSGGNIDMTQAGGVVDIGGQLTVDGNGIFNSSVGVGTNNPSYKLTVDSGTADIGILTASSDSGSYIGFLDNATSTIPKVGAVGNKLILDSANIGLGTTSPNTSYRATIASAAGQTGALTTTGSVYIASGALGVNVAASATAGRIDASNDIVAYSTSDKRLKENIKPIENALDKVKSLTGVEFDWKEEHKDVHGYEGHDVGVIAQEVQEVLPEAIRTNDSGYLSVRYEKLIGLLVEGMKEQQQQIDELKAIINGSTK